MKQILLLVQFHRLGLEECSDKSNFHLILLFSFALGSAIGPLLGGAVVEATDVQTGLTLLIIPTLIMAIVFVVGWCKGVVQEKS